MNRPENPVSAMYRSGRAAVLAGRLAVAALVICCASCTSRTTSQQTPATSGTAAAVLSAVSPSSGITPSPISSAVGAVGVTGATSAGSASAGATAVSTDPDAGDSGQIDAGPMQAMPSVVGKQVAAVRTALGNYPMIFLSTAGVMYTGSVPGTALVCSQKPIAGVQLAGEAATLTISSASGGCPAGGG